MLRISSAIRRTRTPDGTVLLDVEQGRMFSLNPVGSEILEMVERGLGEDEVACQVSSLYGQDLETVRADVHEFLGNLSEQQIIRMYERATGGEKAQS